MAVQDAWSSFVEGLRLAGERLAADTTDLPAQERADGYRALVRALNNQLGRFEVDRERPELVAFNGWREKLLMDNPDFRYFVADIRDDRRYRITGAIGDARYVSLTAYTSSGTLEASASARLDSDQLTLDGDGRFTVDVSRSSPEPRGTAAAADWLELPEGASAIWVRFFHDDAAHERLGWCGIEPLDEPPPPPVIDVDRFEHQLERLGKAMHRMPKLFAGSIKSDLQQTNAVRHWSEMTGGAAFTEPDIHYLRGSWELDEDEALVVEGDAAPCRYWNVLLYSRFLNSLDHRARTVSRTAARAQVVDGRYRFVLAGRRPGPDSGDWLDTEGRRFGLFVMRFLQPEREPTLPSVRRCRIADLAAGGVR